MSARPVTHWRAKGVRLHLPRDRDIAYVVGRMGTATSQDLAPLFYGSANTARFGFLRLVRLGLLKQFPRPDVSRPAWFALTPDAREWVADEIGCEPSALRVVHGVGRMNLSAVRSRNRLWVSLVLACRSRTDIALVLVRPEWMLRQESANEPVVPDAEVVLSRTDGDHAREFVWFVELDAGTERLAVWRSKIERYADARGRRALYGELEWRLLILVPSVRRARSVAAVCEEVSLGESCFLAVQAAIEEGRALDAILYRADELVAAPGSLRRWSLIGCVTAVDEADQRGPSTVDRGAGPEGSEVSR